MNTSTPPLNIYAGKDALAHIQKNGLQGDDIAMLLGASSGPKWLTLHGIDEYLMQHFFKNRTKTLQLMGTSAGAWRMASYVLGEQDNNLAAHRRFTEAYIEQCYSSKPSGQEVLDTCRSVVQSLLGEHGSRELIAHPYLRMNLITTQCHGLTKVDNKAFKTLGFGLAALLNVINRKTLSWQFTRVVMHHPSDRRVSGRLNEISTRYAPLSVENMEDAILSTGSIPLIIQGVEGVAGEGVFQDGGITDYGFDLPLLPESGFVLYPHFSKVPAPGWFDKSLKWRKPSHENYAKTIMLVPSDEFIASLPYQKIPDRHDFLNLSDTDRINYWRKTVELTKHLADDLSTMNWKTRVQALPW